MAMNIMNKCAKFHEDSLSGKKVKFNLPSAIELSETAVLCTTLYRNLTLFTNTGEPKTISTTFRLKALSGRESLNLILFPSLPDEAFRRNIVENVFGLPVFANKVSSFSKSLRPHQP